MGGSTTGKTFVRDGKKAKREAPLTKFQETRKPRPKSKSGKWKSVRELVYNLLEKKTMNYGLARDKVTAEFPTVKFPKSTYSVYKSMFGKR